MKEILVIGQGNLVTVFIKKDHFHRMGPFNGVSRCSFTDKTVQSVRVVWRLVNVYGCIAILYLVNDGCTANCITETGYRVIVIKDGLCTVYHR